MLTAYKEDKLVEIYKFRIKPEMWKWSNKGFLGKFVLVCNKSVSKVATFE
jgi:hypothetical protein